MSGKFIITITGIIQSYRLDIIKKACPDIIKDYVIVFTDRNSYNLYKNHHDDFNFVIIDDYRKNYPFSFEHELLLESPTEEKYWEDLKTFYSPEKRRYYSYDIHRFILPYLAENNILNFAIIDSDVILTNDREAIDAFFANNHSGLLYAPFMAPWTNGWSNFFKAEFQSLYPQINFNLDSVQMTDGFIRGFHFRTKEELMLFFNIWNKSTELLFTDPKYGYYVSGRLIVDFLFLCPLLMNYFTTIGYTLVNSQHLAFNDGKNNKKTVFVHYHRPEDTFYRDYQRRIDLFNYEDVSNISAFIKNNKEKLAWYYSGPFNVEVTDTHVYTSIK